MPWIPPTLKKIINREFPDWDTLSPQSKRDIYYLFLNGGINDFRTAKILGLTPGQIRKNLRDEGFEIDPNKVDLPYIGGYADCPEWKELRKRILERDQYECQFCHKKRKGKDEILLVHHLDGDKTNNDPENLITVHRAECHHKITREGL